MVHVLGLEHKGISRESGRLSNPLLYFGTDLPSHVNARLTWPSAETRSNAYRLRSGASCLVIGGGVLRHPTFEKDFEFWRRAQAPIVLWGGGLYSNEHLSALPEPGLEAYHQLRGFALIGLRDAGTGFTWVPCPSCMHPRLSPTSTRQDGKGTAIILHHSLRDTPDVVALIASQDVSAGLSYSDEPFGEQIHRIQQADLVVTNDYHVAYWATLASKLVIVIGGGGRMQSLKHPVAISSPDDWRPAIDRTARHRTALEECRQANVDFHRQVKRLIGNGSASQPRHQSPSAERSEGTVSRLGTVSSGRAIVPRIVHMVFGLASDFGGKPFNIMHKFAVLSAAEQIKPEQIFLHYRYLPTGPDFEAVRNLLTLIELEPAPDTQAHFAHKADLVRLMVLYEQGGIYLDLDTITVSSFDRLLHHPFSIGIQGRTPVDGLCNAVMVSAPKTRFVRDWLSAYKRFTPEWDKFSVRLPYVMWRSGRWQAHIEPYESFHWPLWDRDGLGAMFEQERWFPNALCHHLWESFSHGRYFEGRSSPEVAETLKKGGSTYARLVRPYL